MIYKRGECYWVTIGEDSFLTMEHSFNYYKSLGFIDKYEVLICGIDYYWGVSKKYIHEGNFVPVFSKSFYIRSGLVNSLIKPEVF